MFGSFRRSKSTDKDKSDKPIIHQSVPDEVLYPDGKPDAPGDLSWLDSVPVSEAATPAEKEVFVSSQRKPSRAPATTPAAVRPTSAKAPTKDTPVAPNPAPVRSAQVVNISEASPNAPAAPRPSHPVGWLVVVEGPGVGQWFVLEKGASHVGRGADQTVCLDFGDTAVAAKRHAVVIYDENANGFVLDGGDGLRLNGVPVTARAALRDGDVFSVGQTSLRMVALCAPNFHWT